LVGTGLETGSITAVADAFREAERITAICHENPDADTMAGAIAVVLMARRLGKAAEIVSADGIPPALGFLPLADEVRHRPELDPDLAVICDAATLERVGRIARDEADWFAGARVLNVDHHVSNNGYGDLNLVDPHASATCEVLVGLADALDIEIDAKLATALLTGIVRDSHGFADGSTTGDTLRTTARLVDAGAPLAQIHRTILAELPYPTMALWARMLATMGEAAGGRVVYAQLTQRMLDETGTEQHDADGLAEFLSQVKGAQVALLLRETGPDATRLSVRVIDGVDATRIVAPFGGGGHARRAGCTVAAPLPDATSQVLETVAAVLGGA
jgi:bifunctional oligoribonuclease and PAP phosphatase NrnA